MNSRIERVIEEAEAELAAAQATQCGTCQGRQTIVVIGHAPRPLSPCPECGRSFQIVCIVGDDGDSGPVA